MSTLNPQAWAIPQLIITTPPDTMEQDTNHFHQELVNLHLALENVAAFVGIQNYVTLPNVPVGTLGAHTAQVAINTQIQTLGLYCVALINAQGIIVQLMSQAIQNPLQSQ